MLRLSQRGWNNVIIFAMLLMILLFNTSNTFLTGSSEEATSVPLLPSESIVMQIDFGDKRIKRIGRGWRVSPASAESEATLAKLVDNWLEARMQPIGQVQLQHPWVVVVWLAGRTQGHVYQFYAQDEQLFVGVDAQLYQLPNMSATQLMLPGMH